jgi:hypothetical protein
MVLSTLGVIGLMRAFSFLLLADFFVLHCSYIGVYSQIHQLQLQYSQGCWNIQRKIRMIEKDSCVQFVYFHFYTFISWFGGEEQELLIFYHILNISIKQVCLYRSIMHTVVWCAPFGRIHSLEFVFVDLCHLRCTTIQWLSHVKFIIYLLNQ